MNTSWLTDRFVLLLLVSVSTFNSVAWGNDELNFGRVACPVLGAMLAALGKHDLIISDALRRRQQRGADQSGLAATVGAGVEQDRVSSQMLMDADMQPYW